MRMHEVYFVRELFGERQSESVVRVRAFRPADEPIHQRRLDVTAYARVVAAVLQGMVAMESFVVERDSFFAVLDGGCQFTSEQHRRPGGMMGLQAEAHLFTVGRMIE